VERATSVGQRQKFQVLNRGRKSVAVDLKDPAGVEFVLRLCETADGLVEGFRPGVTEKLGLGPDVVLARNPKLVYGRMTGWGQDGPMAPAVRPLGLAHLVALWIQRLIPFAVACRLDTTSTTSHSVARCTQSVQRRASPRRHST
jgi:hypothetical protein